MSTWRDAARSAMAEALIKCRAESMTPGDTAKAIDAAYPFGERSHYPYKAWLAERKAFFAQHGLPRNGDHKSYAERIDDLVARMGAKRGWLA